MKIRFSTFLFLFVVSSFAGNIAIGIQNGIGQSFELNRPDNVSSLWGYRCNIYSDLGIFKNIKLQPSISYSQKGSQLLIHETALDQNGNPVSTGNTLKLPSRSDIASFAVGLKPFLELNKYELSILAAPRIDYLFKREIDYKAIGSNRMDISNVTTKWIPGINVDLGLNYKINTYFIGLILNNEIDFINTKADYGDTFRSYKYSIMLNLGKIIE